MENGLSRKFPHRICQLLTPYLTGFSKQTDVPDFPSHKILEKEFTHAAIRQGSREIAETLLVPLRGYLKNLPPNPQPALKAIIGLCTTLAFTLLTPAIYPEINAHSGGWLPSWIDPVSGAVQLLDGPGKNAAKRHKIPEGNRIHATLVAAMTGKPIPVTGYALDNGFEDRPSGPKSTHLAVPAGSVYYFECTTQDAAENLATALNWHGASPGTQIHNRRSTFMGEKGFSLGACSAWSFHPGDIPGHP